MTYTKELWYAVDKDGQANLFCYPVKRATTEDGTEYWEIDVDWAKDDKRWVYTHEWNIMFPNMIFRKVQSKLPQLTWDDEPVHFNFEFDIHWTHLDPHLDDVTNLLLAANGDGSKNLYACNIKRDKVTSKDILKESKLLRRYPHYWSLVVPPSELDKKNPQKFVMPLSERPNMVWEGIEWPKINWSMDPIKLAIEFRIEII